MKNHAYKLLLKQSSVKQLSYKEFVKLKWSHVIDVEPTFDTKFETHW